MKFQEGDQPLADGDAIEATAGVWLSLRDRGMSAKEAEAFVHWLQEDSRHAAAFEALDQTWRDLDCLSELVKPGRPANPDTLAPRYRPRFPKWPVGLAAAAALVLASVLFWPGERVAHFAQTEVGAFQKVDLPDGSIAQLNTDSAIDVDMRSRERRVTIARGEVHFSVHKDSLRPFIVTARNVHVRAVGTAFNVRAGAAGVEVLVTEGRVRLENSENRLLALRDDVGDADSLVAGEKAVVPIMPRERAGESDIIQISKISDEEVRRRLAWQERRLEFDATPLADVVAEFNRYNRNQLIVDDANLAAHPFTGAFRADGYDTFVTLLEQNFGVRVTRESGRIHLARR